MNVRLSLDPPPSTASVLQSMTNSEIYPEIYQRDVLKRLGTAAAVYAGGWILAFLYYKLAYPEYASWSQFGLGDWIPLGALVLSSLAILVSRLGLAGRISFNTAVNLALVFEVAGAFGILAMPYLVAGYEGFRGGHISWACAWIISFPLLVPAPPRRALVASLASASMAPLLMYLASLQGISFGGWRVVVESVYPEYFCALLAMFPARLLRRLSREANKARELGSYRLREKLGEGGMGEVWKAEHRMLARPAAIKLVRPEVLGAGQGVMAEVVHQRFEREARATSRLASPHSISLFDFGVARDGRCYYVMELLDGLDLETLVERFGPMPPARVIHLLLQACHSLADAHHQGLVHRDIKPANIYVCRMGREFDFVKVLDFGLVRASGGSEMATRLTAQGLASGTPAYMPPEIALGADNIDGRADLYALACVAYWMLTGKLLFEAETPLQMALHHVQTEPVPPGARVGAEIPPDLEQVLLACLEKNPALRPRGALEVADRLRACSLCGQWDQERAREWWEKAPKGKERDLAAPSG